MIRGIETLQKSINILQKKQENLSANVANVNTYGYKAQQLNQRTQAEQGLHNYAGGPGLDQRTDLGGITFGTELERSSRNFAQGSLKATNQVTDFAIQGDGFFTLQLGNGQRGYTRNGNFTFNQANQLVTQEGNLVLNRNGQPIEQGAAVTNPNLLITRFADNQILATRGEGIFTSPDAGQVDFQSIVQRNYLETSNVEMADEMVNLLKTAREFETNQKVLTSTDETLRRATNELGKV